ncbi:MAG: response regulator [Desulfobacteraceae bacterium]|jgi:nitrogen-specific signal transduction histidine kinase
MDQTIMNETNKNPDILLASVRSDDLRIISSALEGYEKRVFTAYSIEKIMGFLAKKTFALIIVDSEFPGAGGLKTVSTIRDMDLAKETPLMVIAEKEMQSDPAEYYAVGVVDVLVRPIEPAMMKNKIVFFVDRFKLKSQCESCGLKQEEGSAMKMNRVVADLAGGIAHQFNNTLNIITGHVELLKMDIPDNSYVRSFSTVVFESVKKMTVLTDKLLAYARTGLNRQGRVELNGILSEGLSALSYTREKITVETSFDPGSILVDADESQLRMVFAALFKNAVEAIKDSGRISITTRYLTCGKNIGPIGVTGVGNMVCLEVRDTGEGMSKEVVERIFEPFFTTKFQGRGLDMAAVQGVVTNHGGWIDVQSNAGEGTIVSVFLPVASYRPASEFFLRENHLAETGTILVIDDDDSIRELTVTMLKRLGYQAISASTGREAMDVAERHKDKIDLAMVDIEMPDMKGDELYPHLIRICPDLKVIVCSGYSIDGPGENMIKSGAQLFMQKPFSFGDLAMNMRKLIERRREKRYWVRDGHALIHLCQKELKTVLIDISRKGAAVELLSENVSSVDGWSKIAIVSGDGSYGVSDIPFQFLPRGFCLKNLHKNPSGHDRMNLRFGTLPMEKQREVERFISHCAVL